MSAPPLRAIGELIEPVSTWTPQRDDPDGVFTYLDLSAVDQDAKVVTGARELACSEAPSRARQLVRAGDVLVSTVRPNLNGVALVPVELDGTTASTGFCVLRPRAGQLDSRYLYQWVKSPRFVSDMVRKATGASYPAVSDRIVCESKLPLPPLPEQRRIAEILDKADALLAKRSGALKKLDELTQSIFLDMFGDPATNPKGWPSVPMSTVLAAPPIFGTMIPPAVNGGRWLSLRVANIQAWQLDLTDQKFVELPPAMVERHSVRDGDILLARAIATQEHLGKAVVAYPKGREWAFDSHLMRLRLDRDRSEPEFICHLLRTGGGRRLFLKATRRSAVQFNINTKEISALRIPLPPISLQRAFVRDIAAVERVKTTEQQALIKLNALFTTIQHRAFRGEL